jgi:outer membrane protein assembly factor BamB
VKNLGLSSAPAFVDEGQMVVGNGAANDRSHAFFSFDPQTFANSPQPWPYIDGDDVWMGGPLVFEGVIYAPNSDGDLYAFKPDGTLLGKFVTQDSIWATPVTDGTDLYVASLDHHVYAVDPANLDQALWSAELDSSVVAAPALGEGVLYAGSINNSLYALDAATGKILWGPIKLAGGIWASPALDAEGKTLYVGVANSDNKCTTNCGTFYAINTQDGATVWELPLVGAVTAAPIVHEDTIYFVTEDGIIRAIDSNKKNVWEPIQITGKFYSNPVLAGDLLLVAPTNNKDILLAAYTLDGVQKWAYPGPKK